MGASHELAELAWVMEFPLAGVATVLGLVLLWRYLPLGKHRLFAPRAALGVGLLRISLAFAVAWIVFVLATAASSDIEGVHNYLYAALAISCLLLASFRWPILGLTFHGDVVERGNLAAAVVLAGFAIGTAFAFAGALTGEDLTVVVEDGAIAAWQGGWHVVVVFFLLAYAELRTNLKLVDRLADLDDAARSDRDLSAAVLLAGVAIASGLVAGRAAAGDFTGWRSGLGDYLRRLWPLAVIPIVAALVGRLGHGVGHPMRLRAATAGGLVAAAAVWYGVT